MRKIVRRLLVLLGVFVLAAAAFLIYTKKQEEPEEETAVYEALESATLPIVYTESGSQQINVLNGYTGAADLRSSETPVMPAPGGVLEFQVGLYGCRLTKVVWRVYDGGAEDAFLDGQTEDWTGEEDTASVEIDLGSDLPSGVTYRLELELSLEDGRVVTYYARVRNNKGEPLSKMLQYVMEFHGNLFSRSSAEQYKDNLEQEKSADTSTLAYVTIHTSFNQLAWDSLAPVEAGDPRVEILEADDSFGSFLLEYEVTAGEENTDTYLVSEYFSVQWSNEHFYLMDYRRDVTELFSSDSVTQEGLDFGIVSESDVSAQSSDDGGTIAFTVGGELWSYVPEDASLSQVFTFRDPEDPLRSGSRQHQVKVLQVGDDGTIYFLVYGYMSRGSHEGQLGVSGMEYQAEDNTLQELFFLPFEGSFEYLEEGLEILSSMGSDGQIYLMVGDSVYAVNWEGQELIMMANQVRNRNLVVSPDQTAMAWEMDSRQERSNRVQVLYLDTGDTQTVEVEEGDWVAPLGFIDDDCILGEGHLEDSAVVEAEQVNPFYAIVIRNREGKDEANYQYDGIYISSVDVSEGQVALHRLKKTGSTFTETDDDILIQNVTSDPGNILSLTAGTDDVKDKVYRLVLDESGDSEAVSVKFRAPGEISPTLCDDFPLAAVTAENQQKVCMAWGEGRLLGVTEDAGDAIALSFPAMGAVLDSDGNMVWYRTGRSAAVSVSVDSKTEAGVKSDGLDVCLQMMADAAGTTVDAEALAEAENESAGAAMEAIFPGTTLNLTGSPLKALLYYVNLGIPVLAVEEDHVMLLVGYDANNVTWFDPSGGGTVRQGQNDAAETLEAGISCFAWQPENAE